MKHQCPSCGGFCGKSGCERVNVAQSSQAVELSQQEAEALAHRRASKYAHRSDPSYVAYTFLPHTLMDFVRDVTAAINAKGTP